jgi:hypothetical protein
MAACSDCSAVALDPTESMVATGSRDGTVRIGRHEEVLATLRSWTNLRVVPDAQAATGWKLEQGRFPGWAKAPTW